MIRGILRRISIGCLLLMLLRMNRCFDRPNEMDYIQAGGERIAVIDDERYRVFEGKTIIIGT